MFKNQFERVRRWIGGPMRQAIAAGSPAVISAETAWLQPLDTRPLEIDRISLLFATFQRRNTCRLDIRLFSAANELLHQETVAAETLTDNGLYALKLPDGFVFKGECCLVLTSPDATHRNCVAVWTVVELGGAGLRELPLTGRLIGRVTPAMDGAAVHRGIALAATLGRHSRTHAMRSYMQPGSAAAPLADGGGSNIVALFGFAAEDLQALQSAGAQSLQLKPFGLDDLDQIPSCLAMLIPAGYDVVQARSLARFARRRMVPLVVAAAGVDPEPTRARDAWPSFADGVVTRRLLPASRLPQGRLDDGLPLALEQILAGHGRRQRPKVSIVTILSGKAEQLKWVIASYFDQTYEGEIEVLYVDDCFGNAEEIVLAEFARHGARPHAPKLNHAILRNEKNLGNCASRNRGVAAATGDIVVIIDADCMLNSQFIQAHVDAHAYLDCEVVIGPHNIETRGAAPHDKLAELERAPRSALEESDLQDPVFLDGFLNCITRNFSIKKAAIVEDLFDLDFSYSLAPETGFGWEDVEMGYRLYKRALGIKFTDDAFSVHISHGSSVPESAKPRKSIQNFRKLFAKHPELRNVARRWAIRTMDALADWSSKVDPDHQSNKDLAALQQLFADAPRSIVPRQDRGRKLRVLTYRWHVPHQYELYKSGHDFFLVRGTGSPMCDQWEYGHRPLPSNAHFIDREDINESAFDLALLHFDENVLTPENTNGKVGAEWGAAFRFFVEQIKLPKVAICHGTPQFHGQYTPGYDKPDLMTVIEPARAALVEYVRDIEIVCNSHQAQREWGFHKSRVIWHGFDPSEFLPATYSKGILSPLGPLVTSRPHYRGFYLYEKVFSGATADILRPETLFVPDPDIDYVDNVFAVAKYKNYVDQIRQYSVYFNPTLRSPMPRARCEPMMCGVVTVNANNHDVDLFIKNGVNGFYSNDADELREQLLFLKSNPDAARKIGAEARKTAIDVFNHDRYLAEWSVLLNSVA